jgi:hypothetical protein
MLDQSIWWLNMALEALLLARGLRGNWAARYPVFYSYILFVLLQSLVRYSLYRSGSPLYTNVYWITEFLAVLIGCGITFEVYRMGLRAYPGTARMARNLLCIIFILAATKALVGASTGPHWWPVITSTDLALALRVVQAGSIGALVLLFLIYKVPFGKNLRGVLLGYGLFVGLSVIQFASISLQGERLLDFWSYMQSFAYMSVLGIWVAHLWSYQEVPEPQVPVRIEQEYQRVAALTRRRLQEARGYLGKAVGS